MRILESRVKQAGEKAKKADVSTDSSEMMPISEMRHLLYKNGGESHWDRIAPNKLHMTKDHNNGYRCT